MIEYPDKATRRYHEKPKTPAGESVHVDPERAPEVVTDSSTTDSVLPEPDELPKPKLSPKLPGGSKK